MDLTSLLRYQCKLSTVMPRKLPCSKRYTPFLIQHQEPLGCEESRSMPAGTQLRKPLKDMSSQLDSATFTHSSHNIFFAHVHDPPSFLDSLVFAQRMSRAGRPTGTPPNHAWSRQVDPLVPALSTALQPGLCADFLLFASSRRPILSAALGSGKTETHSAASCHKHETGSSKVKSKTTSKVVSGSSIVNIQDGVLESRTLCRQSNIA